MNPQSMLVEFYISYTHLFGLTAAVVNFNMLPELLTAVARRIGIAPSWHLFDDQGTLDFRHDSPGAGLRKETAPAITKTHVQATGLCAGGLQASWQTL
jgi:hypothetical protein